MPSPEKKHSPIAHLFLSLYETKLTKKDIDIPKFSRQILGLAVNEAINQYVAMREKDATVDPLSVIETTFNLSLELFRQKNPPIILVRTLHANFKSRKKSPYRVAVVQPSIPSVEHYEEKTTDNGKLMIIKDEAVKDIEKELIAIIEKIKRNRIDFVCFPELSFLNRKSVYKILGELGEEKDCFIVAGSFHDEKEESNVSIIFSPQGNRFNQRKIYRASGEGIKEKPIEYLNVIDFLEGGFCVLICIDSEKESIREILKESLEAGKCPVLIFNPSHTEHPKRSAELLANNLMLLVSAAIVFCNTNQNGGSAILVPLAKLKNKGFKMFDLPSSTDTSIASADIDVLQLAKNRVSKQEGFVSLIK